MCENKNLDLPFWFWMEKKGFSSKCFYKIKTYHDGIVFVRSEKAKLVPVLHLIFFPLFFFFFIRSLFLDLLFFFSLTTNHQIRLTKFVVLIVVKVCAKKKRRTSSYQTMSNQVYGYVKMTIGRMKNIFTKIFFISIETISLGRFCRQKKK